ncbi:zinc finger protein 1 homolog [Contarinia nasturtii]|uniref:zinc finger protein 1 homolog n=1 Tax=Contarinia nasturtii TaxID=265458 RepID=UPI0012D44D27|nr:zinc finger protein 1 homolog [Contarinia nasturtii]
MNEATLMDWKNEMSKMLAGFERQANHTLGIIKLAFKRNGLSFDPNFKHYFLRASNERLITTYHQFEIDIQLEEQMINCTPVGAINSVRDQIEDKDSIPKIYVIEINDSSDEEGTRGNITNNCNNTLASVRYKHHATMGNSTLTKRTSDRNESRIGSTTIQTRRFDKELSSFAEDRQNESSAFEKKFQTMADNRQQTNQHRAINRSGSNFNRVTRDNMLRTLAETNQIASFGNVPIFDQRIKIESTSSIDSSTGTYGVPFIINKSNLPFDDNLVVESTEIVSNERRNEARSERAQILKNKSRPSIPSNQMEIKKRFKCNVCEYSSNDKGNLKKHTRSHTGEKPYQCDICRKGFITRQSMKKHKVTHTDEIPFHCRGCFSGFSQKTERDVHEKVCKYRRYECHICKNFFNVNKTQLKLHMRKHNGEKPSRCEICMMRFTAKSSLKVHLDTIHTRNNH